MTRNSSIALVAALAALMATLIAMTGGVHADDPEPAADPAKQTVAAPLTVATVGDWELAKLAKEAGEEADKE